MVSIAPSNNTFHLGATNNSSTQRGRGTGTGIDEGVQTAFNDLMQSKFGNKIVHNISDVFKAQIEFLNNLTPDQLESTATMHFSGSKEGQSWKEYKKEAEAMYGLQRKLEDFADKGVSLLRPNDPGFNKASSASGEYAAVEVLARNLNMGREGALNSAQSYLKNLGKAKDTISLSPAAVALMIQDADKHEKSNSNFLRGEVKTNFNRLV